MREVLEAARSIEKKADRYRVLNEMIPLLMTKSPPISLYALWNEILRNLAYHSTRWELLTSLQALIPIILDLGGREAVADICQAILEVGQWWP